MRDFSGWSENGGGEEQRWTFEVLSGGCFGDGGSTGDGGVECAGLSEEAWSGLRWLDWQ